MWRLIVVVIVVVALVCWLLKLNFLSSIFGSSSDDNIHIVNEGKNDKPKIDPNVGEVTDYEDVE